MPLERQYVPNMDAPSFAEVSQQNNMSPFVSSAKPKMNYATEQRIRFIDFLLYQYGNINRSALVDFFGIGPATATRDFKKYDELAPMNMVYSSADKTYYRANEFNCLFNA